MIMKALYMWLLYANVWFMNRVDNYRLIGHRKEIRVLTFRVLVLRQSDSFWRRANDRNFNSFDKPQICFYSPPTQHCSFARNLLPYNN